MDLLANTVNFSLAFSKEFAAVIVLSSDVFKACFNKACCFAHVVGYANCETVVLIGEQLTF